MTPPRDARHTPPRASLDVPLAIAGVFTTGMALYHFFLPYAWHWGDAAGLPAMLRWALYMLNASFSFLLLAGGALTLAIAFQRGPRDRTASWVIVAMGGYWVFNAVYQVIAPMPMPRSLALLRWCLGGFAASVVLLYAAALIRPRRSDEAAATPAPAPIAAARSPR